MDAGIVIVGAGQAGAEAAAALRAGGWEGPLRLIGAEPHPPYQRPPLSKAYLLGESDAQRLLLKPESWYAEQAIDLITGVSATAIDRTRRGLTLSDGRRIAYDTLLLTTGATPRRLPAAIGGALPGAHVLRTLQDADALAPHCREGAQALVVGGGYIGLEAAAVMRKRGMEVTLVEAASRILSRVAPSETADYFRALHKRNGVRLREGVGLAALEGDDRVTGAVLDGGSRLRLDLAVVGVGVTPNDQLARAAGLRVDDGIAVDATGATSDPAIFAAGDCASFPWRGGRIRLESVQNAVDQARAVAQTLLGRPQPYAPTPWFWSDQYDVKLQIAGLGVAPDRVVTRPGDRPGGQSVWSFRRSELLSVDAMNDARAYMTGKRWLEAGVSPDPDRLADPAIALKDAAPQE
jgi:3-phenylpropionate/trans-cinnamate dioxygenase ferredoxin reductase subunit